VAEAKYVIEYANTQYLRGGSTPWQPRFTFDLRVAAKFDTPSLAQQTVARYPERSSKMRVIPVMAAEAKIPQYRGA